MNACRVVDEDSRGLGSTTGSRGEGNLEETNGAGKASLSAFERVFPPCRLRRGR